jgi:glycopeptide antibiotics resistance protein
MAKRKSEIGQTTIYKTYIYNTNNELYILILQSLTLTIQFPVSHMLHGFVTRLTRRVPLVEQELAPFRSTWVFSGVVVK